MAQLSSPNVDAVCPTLSIAEATARLTAPGERFELENARIGGQHYRVWKNGCKTLSEQLEAARGYGPDLPRLRKRARQFRGVP